jgi:hypothetical protein
MLILDLITRQPFDCEQKKKKKKKRSNFSQFIQGLCTNTVHRSRLPLSVKGDDVYTLIFAGHPRERFENTVKGSCDILISSMNKLNVKLFHVAISDLKDYSGLAICGEDLTTASI